ncbi:MAG TPA: L,D-transpeptidase [Pseudolabrys sp.]|jgi:hypothetical protein|nr:L,D-transpeptidase [Pseudolabrys sp.]
MLRIIAAFAAAYLVAGLAHAEVVITVNKSTQRLSVAVDGVQQHEWPVSTARWGYRTPNGTYHPERLARKWYSRKYDMSPMPYSIFFHGGYAIHGSYEISHIGRPASHGCIRLQPKNAAVLFKLVSANRGDTKIVVTGERPSYRAIARRADHEEASARRYRERLAERRPHRRSADFEDIFAPRYAAGYRPYPTWRDPPPGEAQRAFRNWWYER